LLKMPKIMGNCRYSKVQYSVSLYMAVQYSILLYIDVLYIFVS